MNANKNNIDVWLIYQCEKCKSTWNMTIYERIKPYDINKYEYEKLLSNDKELAREYAFNLSIYNKNKAEVILEVNYELIQKKLETFYINENELVIEIVCKYPIELRVDKLLSNNLGISRTQIKNMHKNCGVTFPMSVMYPTDEEGKIEEIGPFSLDLSINAQPKEGKFPLILISHGSGGGNLLYRTLAHYLARNGFIVGMPEHPFNNFNNNTLKGTVENLENRPRHINIAIDWFFQSEEFSRVLESDSISIIGHSTGGCTALSVAGGVPTSLPNESFDGKPKQINVAHDRKINSLVLLAPGTVWFKEKGALSGVDIPILMIAAEKDQFIQPFQAQIVLEGVVDSSKVEYRIVENAGHFSFLSPFPEFMITPEFFPAWDPIGFDRDKFNNELNIKILDFLMKVK